jgi:hypothetical protein
VFDETDANCDRRLFIGVALAGAVGGSLAAQTSDLPHPAQTRKGDMLFRVFGRAGETVSVLGIGGSDIGKLRRMNSQVGRSADSSTRSCPSLFSRRLRCKP